MPFLGISFWLLIIALGVAAVREIMGSRHHRATLWRRQEFSGSSRSSGLRFSTTVMRVEKCRRNTIVLGLPRRVDTHIASTVGLRSVAQDGSLRQTNVAGIWQ